MKPRRSQMNWPEVVRSGLAIACLIFAFVFRGEGAEIAGIILFGISSMLGLLAWLGNLKFYRSLHDTPTSRIASAAQGYVKLDGYVDAFPDRILNSPITGTECVWYRCSVPGGIKHGIETSESDAPFLLVDGEGQGQCVIEPAGAEVFTHRRSEWREAEESLLRSKSERQQPESGVKPNLVYVDPAQLSAGDRSDHFEEWLLLPGDPLLAMGYFISGEVSHQEPHIKADISQRLTDWKEDSQNLLERFDLNGDQKMDEREWQLARSAARREVLREHTATQSGGQQHKLSLPLDGRPFLLGTFHPQLLAWRYLFFALLNLAAFFVGLWGFGSGIQLLH